ncbi:MAG: ATP synthase F1 subunit delta [Pyrinomonadaceae bacterium]|nr:ATP synthase F1 subunit delta [Pyrinomonadaceae bacterium]
MSVETVARRYAGALADVVLKTGESEIVKNELKSWGEMMSPGTELYKVFKNPSVAQASKEKLLSGLIAKAKPLKTTANFLKILLRNSRLTEISAINERFAEVLDERNGLISANVTSARPLSDAEKAELQANLANLTKKQVNLDFNIDENIISGVITRVGSTVYDGSVRTQLEELRNKLVNG